MRRGLGVLFWAALTAAWATGAFAKTEVTVLREAQVGKPVVDAATSADGRTAYFLTRGEVVIYSLQTGTVTDRFEVDASFDRIGFIPGVNVLMLSGQVAEKVRFVKVDTVFSIPTKGAPFRGRADAPVVVVVFADYQ